MIIVVMNSAYSAAPSASVLPTWNETCTCTVGFTDVHSPHPPSPAARWSTAHWQAQKPWCSPFVLTSRSRTCRDAKWCRQPENKQIWIVNLTLQSKYWGRRGSKKVKTLSLVTHLDKAGVDVYQLDPAVPLHILPQDRVHATVPLSQRRVRASAG